MTPPPQTLLHHAAAAGREIVSVGKIGDLFCHTATGRELHSGDNEHVKDSRFLERDRLIAVNE